MQRVVCCIFMLSFANAMIEGLATFAVIRGMMEGAAMITPCRDKGDVAESVFFT